MKSSSKYFKTGTVSCTPRINNIIQKDPVFAKEISVCLMRYFNKDWGDLTKNDWDENDRSLSNPDDLDLLGVYPTSEGKIYLSTTRISENPGDNATIICFPQER